MTGPTALDLPEVDPLPPASLSLNAVIPWRSPSTIRTAVRLDTIGAAVFPSVQAPVPLVTPGFTATSLNNFEGTDSVEDGTRGLFRLALVGANWPTGTFSGPAGKPIPW